MASVFNLMIAGRVDALLDEIEQEHGGNGRCQDRDRISAAIHALLWMYVSRPDSYASANAWMDLMESLGLDDLPKSRAGQSRKSEGPSM